MLYLLIGIALIYGAMIWLFINEMGCAFPGCRVFNLNLIFVLVKLGEVLVMKLRSEGLDITFWNSEEK